MEATRTRPFARRTIVWEPFAACSVTLDQLGPRSWWWTVGNPGGWNTNGGARSLRAALEAVEATMAWPEGWAARQLNLSASSTPDRG